MSMKTRMRLRPPIGGGVYLAEHNAKNAQSCVREEYCHLTEAF
jgi:hypothetical protein